MIYFPFIYFSILTVLIIYKQKSFSICAYLSSLYALSSYFSILIDNNNLYNSLTPYTTINIDTTIIYCILISFSILPFYSFNTNKINCIINNNIILYNKLCIFFIAIFIIILSINIYDVIDSLSGNLGAIRDSINDESLPNSKISTFKYVSNIIITLFSSYSPLIILFFFYSISYLKKPVIFNILLLISSLTPIITSFLIAGRTQSIYWILSFILIFLIFKKHLNRKTKKIISLSFILIFIFMYIYLSKVTVSRWGKNDALNEIIVYTGQPFINFCNFWDNYSYNKISFERLMPLTNYIFNDNFNLTDYRQNIFNNTGMNIGIFYTFLGDLLVDIGKYGTYIFIVLFFIISNKVSKNKTNNLYIENLFILLILVHIPLHGIFYYSYWKINSSFYIIGSFLLFFLFKKKLN